MRVVLRRPASGASAIIIAPMTRYSAGIPPRATTPEPRIGPNPQPSPWAEPAAPYAAPSRPTGEDNLVKTAIVAVTPANHTPRTARSARNKPTVGTSA